MGQRVLEPVVSEYGIYEMVGTRININNRQMEKTDLSIECLISLAKQKQEKLWLEGKSSKRDLYSS